MKAYFFISFTSQHWAHAPQRHGIVSDYWLCTVVDTHRSLGHACWVNSVPWKCVKESRNVESWRWWSHSSLFGEDGWASWSLDLVSLREYALNQEHFGSSVKSAHLRAYFPSEQSSRMSHTASQSRRENSVLERDFHNRWGTYAQGSLDPEP